MFDQFRQRVTFSQQVSRQISFGRRINRRRNAHRRMSIFARTPIECGETLENRLLLSAAPCTTLEPIQLENTTADESRSAVTADATPTIEWNDADSSMKYEVWVNEVGVTVRQIFATELTNAEFTPDQPLGEGQYRFFIRAEFADGSYGDWSSPYDITVTTSDAISRNFSDSLTWFPQTRFDHYLTTDEPIVQIILPDLTDDTTLILPATAPEVVLVTSSLPPITDPIEADEKPSLDLAEADPDTIDAVDADDPMDAPPKPAQPEADAARPDIPPTDTPPVERIVDEPNTNRTVMMGSPTPREMTIVNALDFDPSVLDKAFADLAVRSMLAAV